MLELMRAAACLAWGVCFVMLSGSAWRHYHERPQLRDEWWSLLWMVSALLFAWGIRNVTMGPVLNGATHTVTCGLLVLQCLIAAGLLRRRFQYEGWKW